MFFIFVTQKIFPKVHFHLPWLASAGCGGRSRCRAGGGRVQSSLSCLKVSVTFESAFIQGLIPDLLPTRTCTCTCSSLWSEIQAEECAGVNICCRRLLVWQPETHFALDSLISYTHNSLQPLSRNRIRATQVIQ